MGNREALWPGWETGCLLGTGSVGRVYEICRDVYGHRERAALKVIAVPAEEEIHAYLAQGYDPQQLRAHYRARLEQVLSACSVMLELKGHPNFVYCDDLRCEPQENGIGWNLMIKMELLTPLPQVLATGMSREQILALGWDISTALAVCQERGVLHEMVKPSNIFLALDGTFKLGDLGNAAAVGKPCGGSLECMAPEVYWGMQYGPAVDVYGLGLVLYRARNGGCLPLVTTETSATEVEQACVRRLTGTPVTLPGDGQDPLDRVILTACAYDTVNRYATAQLLQAALPEKTPVPVEPIPVEPIPVEPIPVEPIPVEPIPVEPIPVEPIPVEPIPVEPIPVEQIPVEPIPVEPIPVEFISNESATVQKNHPQPHTEKKRKSGFLLLLAVLGALLVVTAACYFTIHVWTNPGCNQVKKCRICGKTGGKTAGHKWQEATCQEAATCSKCGETKGRALGHQLAPATRTEPATCTVCGYTQGQAVQPRMWILRLLSTGWQGSYRQDAQGQTATLAFPEDPGFDGCAVTFSGDQSAAPLDEDAFSVSWEDGTAIITPGDDLAPGVYDIYFQNDQANTVLTVCYGYEAETYRSTTEPFWTNSTWGSEIHGGYLAVENGQVRMVSNEADASVFASDRQLMELVAEAVGEPVGSVRTVDYVRDGENGRVVFENGGKYLACDSTGKVYMADSVTSDCYWVSLP